MPLRRNANPTLLKLLESGARVSFQDGSYLQGWPISQYIEPGTEFGSLGLWNMDREGLKNAIIDLQQALAGREA